MHEGASRAGQPAHRHCGGGRTRCQVTNTLGSHSKSRIRIGSVFGWVCVFESGLGIPIGIWIYQGKNDPQDKKESEEISCFVVTRVLFEGLQVSPVT